MPYPSTHVALAIPLAAALPERLRVPLFVGGVLIDGDHLVDYGLHRVGAGRGRSFIPFHGLDVIALVALIALWRRSDRLAAVALGMALHHALDYASERNWVKVSLLWRIARRFHAPGVNRNWERDSPLTWF